MNRNKILRAAADEFAGKAGRLSTPLEIAVVGSVSGDDPHPNDLDLAVIVRNLDELATMAKYARQISSHYHGWEVFLFDENLSPLGRICRRRECPGQSVDCYIPGCGKPPHLRVHPDFEYNENIFLSSPIDVVRTSFEKSLFLTRKEELGIVGSREYAVLEDIGIECRLCGKTFIFTGDEQKRYQKRGLSLPGRCPDCIEREGMEKV